MVDFAGGHPSSEDAAAVIEALDDELGGVTVRFHPGVEYRHIMVAPADWADADCTPPHDLTDKPVGVADRSRGAALRDAHGGVARRRSPAARLAANQIWLWGQGFQPQMPTLRASSTAARPA